MRRGAIQRLNTPGNFVGIVGGRVEVVADDLDELGRELDRVSADPSETFCIEAGRDYEEAHDIWDWA